MLWISLEIIVNTLTSSNPKNMVASIFLSDGNDFFGWWILQFSAIEPGV